MSPDTGLGEETNPTYELQSETPPLLRVPNQPDVLEVAQGDLVLMMYGMY